MRFALLLAAIFCASGVQAADDHLFTYRVQVPAVGSDCAKQAQKMASRFGTSSGIDGVQGVCGGVTSLVEGTQTFGVATVILSYQAPGELSPARAIFGGSEFLGTPSADFPLFPTYAACLVEMQKQIPIFEAQTGALAVAAHCDDASDAIDNGYSMTIETFGHVAQQLYAFIPGYEIQGRDPSSSRIVTSAAKSIEDAGANVVYADPAHVFFYASYDLSVLMSDLGSFGTESECQEQVADATAIFSQSDVSSALSFCEPEDGAFALETVGIGLDLTLETSAGHYATYAECRADRARAVANETSSGENVVGAVCVPASPIGPRGYELHVFTYDR